MYFPSHDKEYESHLVGVDHGRTHRIDDEVQSGLPFVFE
jgi:hypothetical protein